MDLCSTLTEAAGGFHHRWLFYSGRPRFGGAAKQEPARLSRFTLLVSGPAVCGCDQRLYDDKAVLEVPALADQASHCLQPLQQVAGMTNSPGDDKVEELHGRQANQLNFDPWGELHPCWWCRWWAGVDSSGAHGLCDTPHTCRVTALPSRGCAFYEREPGADDEPGWSRSRPTEGRIWRHSLLGAGSAEPEGTFRT